MSFVSGAFLIFYLVVLVLYHLSSGSTRIQNCLLLLASYFFYGWWDWRFLGLLALCTGVNFWAGRAIEDRPERRRTFLAISVAVSLGTLFAFKYLNFFITELRSVLGTAVDSGPFLQLVLPVGISFYTFQALAYSVDVFRGQVRAERDPVVFFAFISFFPQLVAGPIERAAHLLPQFHAARRLTSDAVRRGFWLLVWGYFLKMVIADSAGPIADNAFRPDQVHGWSVILGTVAFGLQIYGDFCGYSLMAKGMAAWLGFELVWNFRHPYWSTDVREFWQRWHISLSAWLRDYLYIPLGGNRRGPRRTYVNLLLTMTLGGLWHGAGWNFLLWGLLHGGALAVHRFYDAVVPRRRRLPRPMAWLLTMLVVFTGWWLFRAGSWAILAGTASALADLTWTPGHGVVARSLLLLVAPLAAVELLQRGDRGMYALADAPWPRRALVQAAALLAILALMDRGRAEFIYFQF